MVSPIRFGPSTVARGALVATILVLLSACTRPLRFQVILDRDEAVSTDTPVFVDATPAGRVTSVGEEEGERVANLEITAREVRDQLCVGVLRVREAGRIQINTEAVKENAVRLPYGARIPTASKAEYLVRKYSRGSTLVVGGVAVAVMVVLWLVFRSLVSTIGLILCVVLSGIVTQVVHPYVAPYVERAMNTWGPPPAAAPVTPAAPPTSPDGSTNPPTASSAPAPGSGLPSSSGVYRQAESTIIEVMNSRPSPRVVTWCLVFVVCFIGFNLVLGRVSRVWRR